MAESQTQTDDAQGNETQQGQSWRDQATGYAQTGGRYINQGYGNVTSTMSEYPLTSVLAGFGLGLGVGLLLGSALSEPPRRRNWYEFDTTNVEQFGRRVLDAIAEALPESMGKRLHS